MYISTESRIRIIAIWTDLQKLSETPGVAYDLLTSRNDAYWLTESVDQCVSMRDVNKMWGTPGFTGSLVQCISCIRQYIIRGNYNLFFLYTYIHIYIICNIYIAYIIINQCIWKCILYDRNYLCYYNKQKIQNLRKFRIFN